MLNFHNSYYAKFILFMFVVFNQSILVMKKIHFYFALSDGHLIEVSRFRFYLRKWFHFPISGFRLISVNHFPNLDPNYLVLIWIPVFKSPKF